ncbi:hypothetical protein KCP71_14470 [Salmonella enterica subsp. enterica]|nr:hypothetical protein KCP71_14470 [Salmonella enterica subsp. enterica]
MSDRVSLNAPPERGATSPEFMKGEGHDGSIGLGGWFGEQLRLSTAVSNHHFVSYMMRNSTCRHSWTWQKPRGKKESAGSRERNQKAK